MQSKLTIVGGAGLNKHGQKLVVARCECGVEKVLERSRIATGRVRSCGCLKKELQTARWSRYRDFAFPARLRANDAGCLEWMGPLDPANGYGQVGYEGKSWRVHRLAYTLSCGPIPPGMFVLHSCDNRRCCNPEHLRVGTHAENMQDMASRGRRKNINAGSRNGRAKLTERQAGAIRQAYAAGGISQERLASQFGVSQFAVSMIVNMKRYIP